MFITRNKNFNSMDKSDAPLSLRRLQHPLTPSFSTSRLAWMDMGGVLAVANLRGAASMVSNGIKGSKAQQAELCLMISLRREVIDRQQVTNTSKLAIQGAAMVDCWSARA